MIDAIAASPASSDGPAMPTIRSAIGSATPAFMIPSFNAPSRFISRSSFGCEFTAVLHLHLNAELLRLRRDRLEDAGEVRRLGTNPGIVETRLEELECAAGGVDQLDELRVRADRRQVAVRDLVRVGLRLQ